MKNQNALDSQGKLIHINIVEKNNEKYTCLECEREMIPKKGKKNAHHFAHKVVENCNFESYLHKLSKIRFNEEYINCLDNKKPFLINLPVKATCNSCIDFENFQIECELPSTTIPFNLIEKYDTIFIEKGHKGFIADIILKSSLTDEIIFIEFAVTHKCSEEKISSNTRIIEIDICSEQDVENFSLHNLCISLYSLNLYNFKLNNVKDKITPVEKCNRHFHLFKIFKSGVTELVAKPMSEIVCDIFDEDLLCYEIVSIFISDKHNKLVELLTEAIKLGVEVKNCYACKFCVKNQTSYRLYPFFCDLKDIEIRSKNIGCEKFECK